MKFIGLAVLGVCALLALSAGVAGATTGGGGTIATALVATAGVQEDGNTASFSDNCLNKYEYWVLQLKQGDLVKITWGAPAAVDTLALWAPGTSDASNNGCLYSSGFSQWTATPVLTDTNATPATNHLAQTVATQDGSYPLLFLDTTGVGNAGAYSFTAVVLHAASVSLPNTTKIPGSGTLTASVRAPDNSAITDSGLTLTLNGYWGNRTHKLATATPTDGQVTFTYDLPPSLWGKKIQLGISGGGASSSYQAVASAKESVKVAVPTGPFIVSLAELKNASKLLRRPVYWAGMRKGFRLEFWHVQSGNNYVRYLPPGVKAGSTSTKYLIVGTYRYHGAYKALQKYAKSAKAKLVSGPNGSIYLALPNDPKSVYIAWPKVDYEVEVYDPNPKVSRAIAATGGVQPVVK